MALGVQASSHGPAHSQNPLNMFNSALKRFAHQAFTDHSILNMPSRNADSTRMVRREKREEDQSMALTLFLSDDDLSIVPPMQTWLGQALPTPCLMTAGTNSIPYLSSLRMIKFL